VKIVIQQVDLDTALTALILGVKDTDQILIARGGASSEDLADPAVLCIEAGGSGQVHLNNFDHHDPQGPREPACRQAFVVRGGDPHLAQLVDYVACIDTDPTGLPPTGFPTLSDVFSGMRLVVAEPREQLRRGLAILSTVLAEGLDPFGTMPVKPEWRGYIEAKRANDEALKMVQERAHVVISREGRRIGFVETDVIGAVGALYQMGCHIAVVAHPHFGNPPVPKITIGGNGVVVAHLIPILNAIEPGWGGPASGTIIGSPRTGTRLTLQEVVEIVRHHG